jgi:MFS family permease
MVDRFKGATRDTFRSLGSRNFRLFFGGQLISQIGNWLTLVAQTLLVLHLTGSGVAVGALTACQFAPVLLLGAWGGLVADRSDKRRLLLIVQTLAMVQSFAMAALAFTGDPPVWAIYVVASFGGLALAFDNPARRSFVVELVDEDDVPNAVSLNSALMTSARVFGPALAGLLAHTVGYGWCFTVDGLSYIAVLVGLWLIDPAKMRPAPLTPRGKGQVREGWRYIRSVPELFVPMVMMAVVGTLAFNFSVVMPLFVERTFDGDDGTFTLLFSVISIGSLIGALATARRSAVHLRDLTVASVGFGVSMLALSLAPSLAVAFPLSVFVGLTSIGFLTAATAIVQVRAEPAMRGRVLALQAMVFLGSTPIGGPILGAVCDLWGARAGTALGGLACLVAAGIGVAATRDADRVAAASAEEITAEAIELEPA